MRAAAIGLLALALAACQRGGDRGPGTGAGTGTAAGADRADGGPGRAALTPPARPPQVKPPLPVASPPADAERLTGIEGAPGAVIHLVRLRPGTGPSPGRNDTVSLNFTGWRTSGETFLSTAVRRRPVSQSLARVAPGFAAAVATMKKGERAMMWIPPQLGYLGPPAATPEVTVYEVELVDFEPGPPTPPDVDAPPARAARTPSGARHVGVKPGAGTARPRAWDLVTIHYSAWSASGRLFDSTEVQRQPRQSFVFREPLGLDEVLRTMTVGERRRVWLPPGQVDGPLTPAGTLCYEVELLAVQAMHEPPPAPRDVAAPPAGAARTPRGVARVVLRAGTGAAHPAPTDRVRVEYTGWTTDGRVFDSSVVRGETAVFALDRMVPGLAEGLAAMVVGERARLWIPGELAYRDDPGAPRGMLVFDLELLEILPHPAAAAAAASTAAPPAVAPAMPAPPPTPAAGAP